METQKRQREGIEIVNNMPDLSNDPFVLTKKQRAIDFLKAHPIPEELFQKVEES
ncbi:hypothetical protein [Dyadobacter pollutisoli]|jgi:hypothetical protein|uniref:Uncharacterized protein n=1 Tax=Dyadobacter pollutisoli TaxID=2910158 RepID=A0A9E8N645_9BACT|nr:hypothetical protein [Dyadobacter pollutisoli]WAC10549.1 hypothetical protein ON006_22725 [Dyadobacter pollutisoli]